MKKYEVEMCWSQCATIIIEAFTEEEARTKANEMNLPTGEYVNDSFMIDEIKEVGNANNSQDNS